MIFPITHEDMTARRWPLVTIAFIVINLVSLIATEVAMGSFRRKVENDVGVAVAYYEHHPYLTPKAPLDEIVAPPKKGPKATTPFGLSYEDQQQEQQYLDQLCAVLVDDVKERPGRQWGYTPAENNLPGLLTYQFVHAGWLHLIFNMWFLWLCGCNLEDRWGRIVFPLFYLGAGAAAALAHKAALPTSTIPLVGASGAIAGAMGAFLVSFAKTKIRFFYLILIKWGFFSAPAYVMLPLWLLTQVFWAVLTGGADGVAYWAHVGGFVVGVGFGAVMRFTGIENKLDDAVERSVSVLQDPRIVKAGELIDGGHAANAVSLLETVIRNKPRSIEAHLELLRAAKATRDGVRELAAYGKLVELYHAEGAVETAVDLYAEMQHLGLADGVARGLRMRMAEQLVRRQMVESAASAYASLCEDGLVDAISVQAALEHARLALRMGKRDLARRLLQAAHKSQFSTPQIDAAIHQELEMLRA
jgi:membrane associated rhomboid family serine protease